MRERPLGAAGGLGCLCLGEGTVFGREGGVLWVSVTRVPTSSGKPGLGLSPHLSIRGHSGLTKGVPGGFVSITRFAKASSPRGATFGMVFHRGSMENKHNPTAWVLFCFILFPNLCSEAAVRQYLGDRSKSSIFWPDAMLKRSSST